MVKETNLLSKIQEYSYRTWYSLQPHKKSILIPISQTGKLSLVNYSMSHSQQIAKLGGF